MKQKITFPLFFLIFNFIIFTGCNGQTKQNRNNDLAIMELPEGTTKVTIEQAIYKFNSNEIKIKSTSVYTFNEAGNFLSHVQTNPDGSFVKQDYSYASNGDLLKIIQKSSRDTIASITSYFYSGINPITITTTVENGNNYVPKIIRHYDGDKIIKEEIFDGSGKIRNSIENSVNETIQIYYDNSGAINFKKIKTLKNGHEVKSLTYNIDGTIRGGTETERDSHGNQTRSWILDKDGNREKESFGYNYLYENDAWVLSIAKEIRDYGSGRVANLRIRSTEGKKPATISIEKIKKELAKL